MQGASRETGRAENPAPARWIFRASMKFLPNHQSGAAIMSGTGPSRDQKDQCAFDILMVVGLIEGRRKTDVQREVVAFL
jgi:hypothetical protein